MKDELDRKNVQLSLQVYETLTDLKRGNMTYTDVVVMILGKAGISLKEVE